MADSSQRPHTSRSRRVWDLISANHRQDGSFATDRLHYHARYTWRNQRALVTEAEWRAAAAGTSVGIFLGFGLGEAWQLVMR
jgi:hypothetical protein